jgi:ADP-ribosyl-[dinitrogen reductase] hydrolase
MKEKAYVGCLLGTAVGDSLGLPYEGISPRRGSRLFPDVGRHHLLFGKGMVSDDTEHACLVAQSLVRSRGELKEFERQLARSLRWWLLGLPAGVGLATLKSILKLWIGFPPNRSGTFSAGNGPAMRSPIIGIAMGNSVEDLRRFVMASTQITHSDPKAFYGALAVALAAYQSSTNPSVSSAIFLDEIALGLTEESAAEFIDLVKRAAASAAKGEPVDAFAEAIGSTQGISGYIYHTVPCVLQVWFRYGADFSGGLQEIISAGGDTDTTGAILGAIIGAKVGKEGIPERWISAIVEWPKTISWMERLGVAVARTLAGHGESSRCPGYFAPGIVIRNLVFLFLVLAHGLRRLAPPY